MKLSLKFANLLFLSCVAVYAQTHNHTCTFYTMVMAIQWYGNIWYKSDFPYLQVACKTLGCCSVSYYCFSQIRLSSLSEQGACRISVACYHCPWANDDQEPLHKDEERLVFHVTINYFQSCLNMSMKQLSFSLFKLCNNQVLSLNEVKVIAINSRISRRLFWHMIS